RCYRQQGGGLARNGRLQGREPEQRGFRPQIQGHRYLAGAKIFLEGRVCRTGWYLLVRNSAHDRYPRSTQSGRNSLNAYELRFTESRAWRLLGLFQSGDHLDAVDRAQSAEIVIRVAELGGAEEGHRNCR